MTERYSGHDTGIVWMLLVTGTVGAVVWALAVVGVLHLLGVLR